MNNRLIEIFKKILKKHDNDFNRLVINYLNDEDLFYKIYNSKDLKNLDIENLKKLGKTLNQEKEIINHNTNATLRSIPHIKSRLYIIATYFISELINVDDNIKVYIENHDCLYVNMLTVNNILYLGSEEVFNDTYERAKLIELIYVMYGEYGVYKYLLINKKLVKDSNHDLYSLIKNQQFDYKRLFDLLSGKDELSKLKSSSISKKIIKNN